MRNKFSLVLLTLSTLFLFGYREQILPTEAGGSGNSTTGGDVDVTGDLTVNGDLIAFPTATADPTGTAEGQLYFKTDTDVLRFYNGTSWATIGTGGTLNDAYDFGGAGAGRTITVDSALPVELSTNSVTTGPSLLINADATPGDDAAMQFEVDSDTNRTKSSMYIFLSDRAASLVFASPRQQQK